MNATPESLIKDYADPIDDPVFTGDKTDTPVYQGYVGYQASYVEI